MKNRIRQLAVISSTALMAAVLVLSMVVRTTARAASSGGRQEPAANAQERFDFVVRDDFFAGFNGDKKRFDSAMKACNDALAKNPKDAQALVWHGSGLLFLAGKEFQKGDQQKGSQEWGQGLSEMDQAVALDPRNISVLIPRAATLVNTARYDPDSKSKHAELTKVVSDYGTVYAEQKSHLSEIGTHPRGELLFGLAEAYAGLGDTAQEDAKLNEIEKTCAGSPYATEAHRWLTTTPQKPSDRFHTCIGCHG